MNAHTAIVSLLLATLLTLPSLAQRPGAKTKAGHKALMPVYVTPFYNSEGCKIDVGRYSKQLATADARTVRKVVADLEKEQDKLRVEVMYIAAIRLYDLGHKDEAVYWFYAAQYRGRLFTALLDPAQTGGIGSEALELKQAYNSFNQLAGTYINGHAFGQLPKLEKTLQRVADECKAVPPFEEIYPAVKFIPKDEWEARNKVVSNGLAGLVEFIQKNPDSIRQQRKAAGIEGKY